MPQSGMPPFGKSAFSKKCDTYGDASKVPSNKLCSSNTGEYSILTVCISSVISAILDEDASEYEWWALFFSLHPRV
jgi:hypothetical protein